MLYEKSASFLVLTSMSAENFASLRNHILILVFPVLISQLHIKVLSGLNVNLLSVCSLSPARMKVAIFFLIYRLQQKQWCDYSSNFRQFFLQSDNFSVPMETDYRVGPILFRRLRFNGPEKPKFAALLQGQRKQLRGNRGELTFHVQKMS